MTDTEIYKPVSPLSDSVQREKSLVCLGKVLLRDNVTIHILPSQGDNVYKLEGGSLLNNDVTIIPSIILQLVISHIGLSMVGICEHLCNLCESRPSGLEDTLGESPDIIEKRIYCLVGLLYLVDKVSESSKFLPCHLRRRVRYYVTKVALDVVVFFPLIILC